MERRSDTILVVDDDPLIQEALQDRLVSMGHRVLLAANGNQALEIIDQKDLHLMLLDIEMPGVKGLEVLKEIHHRGKNFPVVMITAYGTIDLAVEAMKEGAFDFIPKPFKPGHIALVVKKALEWQALRSEVQFLVEEVDKRYRLITGKSAVMNLAVEAARKAALSNSTVLLLGESGTGKELFARAIHNWSARRERPFVPINCVGLSKELLESELFGHEKGAFTGAHQLKKGRMELAHGGTVFLDELGDVSAEVQTKLLRFLQEREFERVGGLEPISVDVRIIAATNRDLDRAVQEKRFREDLYYRLKVIPITLPPLRERKEDIPELTRYFVGRLSVETKREMPQISPQAMEKLIAYHWPGNVRELANTIERALVLSSDPTIDLQDLNTEIAAREPNVAAGRSYHEVINDYRRDVIGRALSQTQGNRSAAAKLLGLERSYLIKLMKSFNIE